MSKRRGFADCLCLSRTHLPWSTFVGAAADAPGTLTAIFAQTKAKETTPKEEVVPSPELDLEEPTAAAAASSLTTAPIALTDAEDETLRSFDLHQEYGPMLGTTRLQRWRRAHKFGLDPPGAVLSVLEKLDDDHPAHECIFNKYPL